MADSVSALEKLGIGTTERKDAWWLGPLLTVLGLSLGFGYLTFAAFWGDPAHGHWGPYLSPVYSPPVNEWFPSLMKWVPAWVSPAALILWAPGGFRATCYYYRKAYYRSFFAMPPACAVKGVPFQDYKGERGLLIVQNIHRFFMYLALLFIFIFLPWDVIKAFAWPKADGGWQFGMGLGTVIMFVNWAFISGYTLGCHSFRHLAGGKLDCFSCSASAQLRYGIWKKSTFFNQGHMQWAWISLASVGFTDLYIRLVANGIWHDLRFF